MRSVKEEESEDGRCGGGGTDGSTDLSAGLSAGLFFAGLGLPGLCGVIGEVFVVLSAWNKSAVLAIVAAGGVILTAGYILWTMQRVFLGAEYKGPHEEDITPINGREATVGIILLAAAIVLGVYPTIMFDMMRGSMALLVQSLEQGYQVAEQAVNGTASLTP